MPRGNCPSERRLVACDHGLQAGSLNATIRLTSRSDCTALTHGRRAHRSSDRD